MNNKYELLAKTIDEFFIREYQQTSTYEEILRKLNNPEYITIAYTNAEYDKNKIFEAALNIYRLKIEYIVDDEIVDSIKFENVNEIAEYIKNASFDSLLDDDNFGYYSKYTEVPAKNIVNNFEPELS